MIVSCQPSGRSAITADVLVEEMGIGDDPGLVIKEELRLIHSLRNIGNARRKDRVAIPMPKYTTLFTIIVV
jgi:hypothetical protein